MTTLVPILLPVNYYSSPQTNCICYIVTISNGLRQIVKSYLGIKCTKPSRYSLHRYSYFKNIIFTNKTSNGNE